ncbi:hypothetical protein V1524DRAFT_435980 [Lipomyces starkeyi]
MFGSSTELGICPQRILMWDDFTVEEHVRIWTKSRPPGVPRRKLSRSWSARAISAQK